jgi:hypothetical protein
MPFGRYGLGNGTDRDAVEMRTFVLILTRIVLGRKLGGVGGWGNRQMSRLADGQMSKWANEQMGK